MLSKQEMLPRRDLDDLMDKKIRAITRLAYDHNPFVHGLFKASGMNPQSDNSGRADHTKAYKKRVRTAGAYIEKCYADYASQVQLIEIWTSGRVPSRSEYFCRKAIRNEWCLRKKDV